MLRQGRPPPKQREPKPLERPVAEALASGIFREGFILGEGGQGDRMRMRAAEELVQECFPRLGWWLMNIDGVCVGANGEELVSIYMEHDCYHMNPDTGYNLEFRWDAASGSLQSAKQHADEPYEMYYRLASCGNRELRVRVPGDQLGMLSSRAQRVGAGGGLRPKMEAQLWRAGVGRVHTYEFQGHYPFNVRGDNYFQGCFSNDGSLAAVAAGAVVSILRTEDGTLLTVLDLFAADADGALSGALDVTFLPGNSELLVLCTECTNPPGGGKTFKDSGYLQRWNIGTAEKLAESERGLDVRASVPGGHGPWHCQGLAVGARSAFLLAGDDSRRAKTPGQPQDPICFVEYDLFTLREQRRLVNNPWTGHSNKPIALLSVGDVLVSCDFDGTVVITDTVSGQVRHVVQLALGSTAPRVRSFELIQAGFLAVVESDDAQNASNHVQLLPLTFW